MILTQLQITAAKPKEKPYRLPDGQGLALFVQVRLLLDILPLVIGQFLFQPDRLARFWWNSSAIRHWQAA